jgi:hypothetical protein
MFVRARSGSCREQRAFCSGLDRLARRAGRSGRSGRAKSSRSGTALHEYLTDLEEAFAGDAALDTFEAGPSTDSATMQALVVTNRHQLPAKSSTCTTTSSPTDTTAPAQAGAVVFRGDRVAFSAL